MTDIIFGHRLGLPLLKYEKLLKESCLFDARWYLDTHADVVDADMSAEMHFLMHGTYEGRDPSAQFSTMDYYLANPDVPEQGVCAVLHFILYGKQEGRALRPS